jgi:hypothetical protein
MDNESTLKIDSHDTKRWRLNDKLHRVDGPAIEYANGSKYWCLYGERHREDGPAVEFADGSKFWYRHGKSHREDGPADEWTSGNKYWFLDGYCYTFDEWLEATTLISEEEKVMMKLQYG